MDELVQELARKMYNDPSGWVAIVAMLTLPVISFLSSIVSATVKDGSTGWRYVLMRFINALAINFGKAKNDPMIQKALAMVAILPAVAMLSGCAMGFVGQTPKTEPAKAAGWVGVDLGSKGFPPEGPTFDDSKFVDVKGKFDFFPPAAVVGVQVKPIVHDTSGE